MIFLTTEYGTGLSVSPISTRATLRVKTLGDRRSALTYQLRSLGYEIESGKSGAPEIKGYSQEYLDASSPRSRQIKEQLERSGYSGPEAAQIAAHSTRDRKQSLSAEEVIAAHKEVAAAFGNQPQKVIAAARERAFQQDREPDRKTLAKEAVTFARDGIFEREAVADERTILRDALRRGMGEASCRGAGAKPRACVKRAAQFDSFSG
jgi:hypothetical protein